MIEGEQEQIQPFQYLPIRNKSHPIPLQNKVPVDKNLLLNIKRVLVCCFLLICLGLYLYCYSNIFQEQFDPISIDCQLHEQFKNIINQTLKPFQKGVDKYRVKDLLLSQDKRCLVSIKNKQLEPNHCIHPHHRNYFASFAHHLPDLQFVITYMDEPSIYKNPCNKQLFSRTCGCDSDYSVPFNHGYFASQQKVPHKVEPIDVPLFGATAISKCFTDIILPSVFHLESHFSLFPQLQWEKKQFKAFWRGRSTGGICTNITFCNQLHRQRLILLCKGIPDCDAKFIEMLYCSPEFCKQMQKQYGIAPNVGFSQFRKNKVLIDIDGNTYSGRFPALMKTGSLVFKISIFQDLATLVTEGEKDYVPIKMDLSDFQEKLEWVRANDEEARKIAERGKRKMQTLFSKQSLQCYGLHLLTGYHKLLS